MCIYKTKSYVDNFLVDNKGKGKEEINTLPNLMRKLRQAVGF